MDSVVHPACDGARATVEHDDADAPEVLIIINSPLKSGPVPLGFMPIRTTKFARVAFDPNVT